MRQYHHLLKHQARFLLIIDLYKYFALSDHYLTYADYMRQYHHLLKHQASFLLIIDLRMSPSG